MADRIMAAAQAWADAREHSTNEPTEALGTLQRAIADEIAAAVAAETKRWRDAVRAAHDETVRVGQETSFPSQWRDAAHYMETLIPLVKQTATPPAPTPVDATPCPVPALTACGGIDWTTIGRPGRVGVCERTEACDAVVCPLRPATPADEARALLDEIEGLHNDRAGWSSIRRAIRAYGDARARAASAVPGVVREAVAEKVRFHRDLADTVEHKAQVAGIPGTEFAAEVARWRSHADALDAWLRATAGAEGVRDA